MPNNYISPEHSEHRTYYIYKITNKIDGKTYIGQRLCPIGKTPFTDTKYMGRGIEITRSERKHGRKNFSKDILAVCHSKQCIDLLEINYIKLFREIGKAEYNIANGGQGGTGVMTEIQRKRIGDALRGRKLSDERKRMMSERSKGKSLSEEGRRHLSESLRRYWSIHTVSEETRNKRSRSLKGRKLSAEHIEKLRKSFKNRVISEETRRKLSVASKGRILSNETKVKISNTLKGHNVSEETRLKISVANTGRHVSEGVKKHLSELNTGRKLSEETKRKLAAVNIGQKRSDEAKRHMSEAAKRRDNDIKWFTDGVRNVRLKVCPDGFRPGRTGNFKHSEETKRKISESKLTKSLLRKRSSGELF